MNRLRISHVAVQPVLVWDDGEELTAGPEIAPVTLPVSQVAAFMERLPDEVEALANKVRSGPPA